MRPITAGIPVVKAHFISSASQSRVSVCVLGPPTQKKIFLTKMRKIRKIPFLSVKNRNSFPFPHRASQSVQSVHFWPKKLCVITYESQSMRHKGLPTETLNKNSKETGTFISNVLHQLQFEKSEINYVEWDKGCLNETTFGRFFFWKYAFCCL